MNFKLKKKSKEGNWVLLFVFFVLMVVEMVDMGTKWWWEWWRDGVGFEVTISPLNLTENLTNLTARPKYK